MTKLFPAIIDADWNIPWCVRTLGEEIHFTELLDEQPDGWLNSLHYYRNDLPKDNHAIYDCGAWSYRNQYTPPIDSKKAANEYNEKANSGSIVIAPDHMLIDGVDIKYRQEWNRQEAVKFLQDCPNHLTPMGVIHGITLNDRIENAENLINAGYQYVAIGGVAGLGGKMLNAVVEIVETIKKAIPTETHLHVLGLTNLRFFKEWLRIGVSSVDGSAHTIDAINGKIVYYENGVKMSYAASKTPGSEDGFLFEIPSISQAPECDCRACLTLRKFGKDTRQSGSKAKTIGRAFHNLNMYIKEINKLKKAHVNQ